MLQNNTILLKMSQDEEFLQEILRKKKLSDSEDEDKKDSSDEDSGYFSGEEENEEDDDQRFIGEVEDVNEKIFENIKEELNQTLKDLEGIRPEGNQQRNLDREVGGLEQKQAAPIVSKEEAKDIWDDRSKQILEMEEEAQEELVDAATSSMRQSFIGDQKRRKKRARKNHEEAASSFDEMSHVQRLRNMREDKSTSTSVGDRGRW